MNDPAPSVDHRRIGGNFLKLLRGRGAAAVLHVAATALTARALPPEDFGQVALLHAWLLVMHGLATLKPFEAIVHFGVRLQERGDRHRLAQLLRMTSVLDAGTAVAAALVALATLPLVGPLLGWDEPAMRLAAGYGLLLLTGATGTAVGVLRLTNRFGILAGTQVTGAAVLLVGVLAAWTTGGGPAAFAAAHGAGWVARNAHLVVAGSVVRRHQLGLRLRGGEVWHRHRLRFPGFWRFLRTVYWQSNIDLLPKHAAVLAAGHLLGATAAGQFRLALQFSRILAVPALLLRQVLFPDLARLWDRRDARFQAVVDRVLSTSVAAGAGIALLALAFGGALLEAAAGPEYRAAAAALFWLMLAGGLDIGASVLRAAGYAMGRARDVLHVSLASAGVYVAVFPVLSLLLGLAGTGLAAAVAAALSLVLMRRLARRPPRDGDDDRAIAPIREPADSPSRDR